MILTTALLQRMGAPAQLYDLLKVAAIPLLSGIRDRCTAVLPGLAQLAAPRPA
ncbi:hypothetical protein H5368_01760 [Luteimonas sp. MC1782]|uniref:hypothetical protein n=1 Tax=Luteimonas sp. MC1782 TaxID=2760305 RepID=UPI00160131A2|nr:hypothetical protein [Luteimonas sp. MC1782]MBB1471750.1 hypothetical protein [Luteimonas sp. MC1782]